MGVKQVFKSPVFRRGAVGAGLGGGLGYAVSDDDKSSKIKGTLSGAFLGGLMGASSGAADQASQRFRQGYGGYGGYTGGGGYYRPPASGPSYKEHLSHIGATGKETTKAELKRKWKTEAFKHHPDRGGSEERMKKINNAWENIRNHPDFHKLAYPDVFWDGFVKRANLLHTTELAGLGTLAAPSVAGLSGKPWSEKNKDRAELAGLGVLAVPSAIAAGKGAWNLGKKLIKR